MKVWFTKETAFYRIALLAVFLIATFYRLYQPIKFQALTQFDIFDWATQSKQILLSEQAPGHNLFVFPLFNSILSKITDINLFYVYLFGGAVITLITFLVILKISEMLFENRLARLFVLLLYSTSTFLLPRSIMYLPEAFTYLIGMYLVYLFVKLFKEGNFIYLVLIFICNYFFFHLHQNGLNFIFFSVVAVVLFLLLHPKYQLKIKLFFISTLAVLVTSVLLLNKSLLNNFRFFLTRGDNLDPAFNGVVIPFANILTAFSVVFFLLLMLGAITEFAMQFRQKEIYKRQAFLMIFLITFVYFCFLYLFPNLNIYKLYPWRFYTWFSLYGALLAGYGLNFLFQRLKQYKTLKLFLMGVMIFVAIPTSLVFDTMFTADLKTLDAMSKLPIQNNALVLTTNANYFQAKYAFLGKPAIVNEVSQDLFRAASAKAANDFLKKNYPATEIYILVSLYQLRQRPGSIDYWRNHAIFDMNLKLFSNREFFSEIFRDDQVLLVKKQ
ncbi:hypothetical protein C4546_03125 [Candidatus Parcubacteria bacterium]|jgi:hypothetical protein|nr:MAG: hypothetical protein C4546_03125 [Candidatus Parcubacteria bacterium]